MGLCQTGRFGCLGCAHLADCLICPIPKCPFRLTDVYKPREAQKFRKHLEVCCCCCACSPGERLRTRISSQGMWRLTCKPAN
jgi:hypothetical protein